MNNVNASRRPGRRQEETEHTDPSNHSLKLWGNPGHSSPGSLPEASGLNQVGGQKVLVPTEHGVLTDHKKALQLVQKESSVKPLGVLSPEEAT